MAAVGKRKADNQSSCKRKCQRKQTRWRKPQPKRGRKAKSGQVRKCVKNTARKKQPSIRKERQLTSKAKGVLGSCVEGLCQAVSSEADHLRKENHEPQISGEVLLTALERSMSKERIRNSVTPGIKKTKQKKQPSVEVTKKTPSSSEPQAAENQKLPKRRKRPPTPVSN